MFFRVGFGVAAASPLPVVVLLPVRRALFAGLSPLGLPAGVLRFGAAGFGFARSASSPTTCLARALTPHFARTGFPGSAVPEPVFSVPVRRCRCGALPVLPRGDGWSACSMVSAPRGGSPGLCANCAGDRGGASFPARGARRHRRLGRLWRLGLGHVGVKEGFTQAGTAVYGAQMAAVTAGAAHADGDGVPHAGALRVHLHEVLWDRRSRS